MDKCVKIAVAVALAAHIVTGRSYHTAHDSFHHDFEHEQSPSYHHQGQRDHNPHGHPPNNKQFWRSQPHSHDTQPPSWESRDQEYPPELPEDDEPDFWAHHQGSEVHSPNRWPHFGPDDWSYEDKPTHWPHGNPHNWHEKEKPSWNNNRPTGNQGSSAAMGSNTPTRDSASSSSQNTLAVTLCIRSCPVTPEYNPVCGSNNVTYGNPGRLECAKYCGVDVSLSRNSPCSTSAAINNAQTTLRPLQPLPTLPPIPPTRFTTVDPPASTNKPPVTISQDILNSIFTTTTTTEDDNYDLDIRTRSRFQPPLQYVYPIPK